MALFLLKRSGYDPSSFITTMNLLGELEDLGVFSILLEATRKHPLTENRVSRLQDNIFKFERTFQEKYAVAEPPSSFYHSVRSFFHLECLVSCNKHSPPYLLYTTIHVFLNHYSIIIFFAMKRSPTSSSRSLRCRYSFSFFTFPFIRSNSSSYVPMSSSERFTLDTRGCTIVSGKFTQ